MKIIDLLNKIANGEEVPKKIKYKNKIYERYQNTTTNNLYYYQVPNKNDFLIYQLSSVSDLLDEVEIIEEPKKIEKLDVTLLGQCDNWLRCPTNKVTKQDVELNPYIIDNIRENTLYFQRKINELIDEINNLKEND